MMTECVDCIHFEYEEDAGEPYDWWTICHKGHKLYCGFSVDYDCKDFEE